MATLWRSRPSTFRHSHTAQAQIPFIFLQLPPSYRAFHASPQTQFLDVALSATHNLLEGLHSFTGLPWAATLPLAALTIRTTLVLPIAIYSRRAQQKQVALTPLMSAWQHQLRKETMQEVGHLGPVVAQRTVVKKMREKQREIYTRFGCGRWKLFLPIVQLPIWLLAIETIRKMCGTRTGLLGLIAAQFSSSADPPSGPEGVLVEETFATEGALWFENLLVPDPQLILPFMLSGVMFLNLSHAQRGANQTIWQRRLMNSLKVVALAIGPLTLQIPSAMLVYWISSGLLAYTQGAILDKIMPVKPPVLPCKPKRHFQSRLPGLEDKL